MPLSLRKNRAIAELKMYENITEILKVDKIPEEMKDLNIKEIIENLHYRKSILEEISNADLDNIKPERIAKIEDRLLKSDEYFINLGQTKLAAVEKFFETQPESVAKSPLWQAYHMAFATLSDLDMIRKSEDAYITYSELYDKAKDFIKVDKETKKFIRQFENDHPGVKVTKLQEDIHKKESEVENHPYNKLDSTANACRKKINEIKSDIGILESRISARQEDLETATKMRTAAKTMLELIEKNEAVIRQEYKEYSKVYSENKRLNAEHKKYEDILKEKNDESVENLKNEYIGLPEKYNDENLKAYRDYQENYNALSALKAQIIEGFDKYDEETFKNNSDSNLNYSLHLEKLVQYGLITEEKMQEMTAKENRVSLDEFREFILKSYEDLENNYTDRLENLFRQIPQNLQQLEKETFEKWQTEKNEVEYAKIKEQETLAEQIAYFDANQDAAKKYSKVFKEILKDIDLTGMPEMKGSFDDIRESVLKEISRREQKIKERKDAVDEVEKVKNIQEANLKNLEKEEENAIDQRDAQLDDLREKEAELNNLKEAANDTELKEHMRAYNAAHMNVFEDNTAELPASMETQMIQSLQQQAAKLYEKQKMYASGHKNSDEFKAMMAAFKRFIDMDITKDDVSAVAAEMNSAAELYEKAKKEQKRPFPSAMRITRLALKDTIKAMSSKINCAWEVSSSRLDYETMSNLYREKTEKAKEAAKQKEEILKKYGGEIKFNEDNESVYDSDVHEKSEDLDYMENDSPAMEEDGLYR